MPTQPSFEYRGVNSKWQDVWTLDDGVTLSTMVADGALAELVPLFVFESHGKTVSWMKCELEFRDVADRCGNGIG